MPSRCGSKHNLLTSTESDGLDRTHHAARFGMLMVKEAVGESAWCVAWMWSRMSDQFTDPRGYQCYWKRIARHIGLSEAGKQLGIRASQLSAFERGKPHQLSEEQIQAYCAFLEAAAVSPSEGDEAPAEQPAAAEP